MKICENCKTAVKGDWKVCPLCQAPLKEGTANTSHKNTSLQDFSLRFSRQNIYRALITISIFAIILYFIIQAIWSFEFFGLEYIMFGLMVTWLSILTFIRKRRNIAKAIVYLLVLLAFVSVYFDYLNGWQGWSLTFNIPILSISTLVGMMISIHFIKLRAEDYVLYLELAALLGFIPFIFLNLGWVVHPLPSLFSVLLSLLVFIFTFKRHRHKIKNELKKRFHI